MYGLVMLSMLGGCGSCCGPYPPPEWCACKCPKSKGGLVVLYFPKLPGIGPEAEHEWMEYIEALETWERPEYMYIWHKADVCGKWKLLNQVRLMKLERDIADAKDQMKEEDKKDDMKDKIDQKKDDDKDEKDGKGGMVRGRLPGRLPQAR